jgi:hypothetical protein
VESSFAVRQSLPQPTARVTRGYGQLSPELPVP